VSGRALVLGQPSTDWLRALAGTSEQVVVFTPDPESAAVLRREFRAHVHVMVAAAEPPAIPWIDGFFDRIYASAGWPESELRRVAAMDAHLEALTASEVH
jgi:hypothetical protein